MATIQLMTDYMTRLMRYVEFMKKVVPMHDDLFDFFYEALPGYEKVGLRRTLLGCWGSFQDPEHCNFDYKDMENWGRKMFVTPGVVVDGKLVTTSLVDINLGIRILLGSSYYDDWTDQEMFVKTDPLGNPVDRRHPWNQHTNPQPQKRDIEDKYSWVMSPRWFDGKDHLALDTGGGPLARLWSTALAGLVDIGYVKSTGSSVQINLPKTALKGPVELEWKIPQHGSNTIERNRARTYFQAYAAACALHFAEKALAEIRAGRTKTWEKFDVPDEGIGCGFTEAVRGVLSHHMVIRDGKIANYHPYPPTPWNANPRDSYGTPGPYEDAVQGQPIFEENDREHFKGIDIMRTVRSFDPCLPCGVHMYLGNGKTLEHAALPDSVGHRGIAYGPIAPDEPAGRRAVAHGGRSDTDAARRERGGWHRRAGTRRATGPRGHRPLRRRAGTDAADRYRGRSRARRRLAADDLVASLLLVHGLHPHDVRAPGVRRAGQRAALPRVARRRRGPDRGRRRPGQLVVRLQFSGSCKSCPSSAVTLELAVEDAVRAAAPEIASIEVVARRTAVDGPDDPGGFAADPRARPGTAQCLAPGPRRWPSWRPARSAASWSRARRCWPAGSATTCSPTGTAAAAAASRWPAPCCTADGRGRCGAALPALPRSLRRRARRRVRSTGTAAALHIWIRSRC